jgi:hypothetical protein
MTTPNYCPGDLPPCPEPSPCNETFDSKCVIYTGEDLPCIGVEQGNSIEQVILALNEKLSPLFCLECPSLNIPANNAVNIPYDQTLNWNAVPGATSYDVYFGTTAVNPPLVSAGQISTAYTYPYPLLPGTDYYWKVVPKNATSAAQNCATYQFKTKEVTCVNPLSYMLEYVMSEQPLNSVFNPGTLVDSIVDFLNNGELITNCNFCCPDCKDTNRYVLASAPLYALHYSQFYSLPNCPPICCTEVDASLTAMIATFNNASPSLSEAFKDIPPVTNCCGTNFSECADSLKVSLGTSRDAIFKLLGVVEESTISNTTQLCVLSTFLNSLPPAVTDAQKASIIAAILNNGFVVDCRPEGTIISGIQKYKQYITAVQDGCLCYKPCITP